MIVASRTARCAVATTSRQALQQCQELFASRAMSTNRGSSNTDVTVSYSQHLALEDSQQSSPTDYDTNEATVLVDNLLQRTRQIMNIENNSDSNSNDSTMSMHHVIAFSGGIDSSLVAALLKHANTDTNTNHVIRPVLGLSPAVPSEQVDLAHRICDDYLQLELETVNTNEGSDATYIANAGQACLACKTHLYGTLQTIADSIQREQVVVDNSDDFTTNQPPSLSFQLYNGTNADDLLDPTRLGLVAAQNYNVHSPIDNITKSQVRLAARHLGLPHWNTAASPCLRSRLALGVPATQQHLQQMARAERIVKNNMTPLLRPQHNVRVRLLARQQACIEVDFELMDAAERVDWTSVFFGNDNNKDDNNDNDDWTFKSISLRPFKSGSVSRKPIEQQSQPHQYHHSDEEVDTRQRQQQAM